MRAVDVLEVADPASWAELEAQVELHAVEVLDPRRRVVGPAFLKESLPRLAGQVLVRWARRTAAEAETAQAEVARQVAALRHDVRRVLVAAQRHALDGVVIGRQAWDPEHDAAAVRALHTAGLLVAVPGDPPLVGRYRLDPDLPDPPAVAYDFADAVMDETDDLAAAAAAPVALLHDLASLAAGLAAREPALTTQGTVAVADGKALGARLADAALAASGKVEAHPRWGRALRALQALGAVDSDPITRVLHLDLGLERTLAGETHEALDRLVHRLVDRDLHVLVPPIREALRQAGDGALDEVVFADLLREHHRDVLFPAWRRDGEDVYPDGEREPARAYDDDGWERVEARMIHAALGRLAAFGIVRRAPGVFAATPDGRRWARVLAAPHPPIWVSGDLELIVPPDALTPWERFQVERLGRCLQRDVVDRYRLEREGLVAWMATHEPEEAIALLRRRSPGLPAAVVETIDAWAAGARRVVLTRGVLRG